MDVTRERAEALLQEDESDLYRRLGDQLYGQQALPVGATEKIAFAKEWFAETRGRFAHIVCGNARVRAFGAAKLDTHELVVLIAEIADLLSHHAFGVDPFLISALLVRRGLHTLCHEVWNTE